MGPADHRGRAVSATRPSYIAGPAYDWAFFLLPPTYCLALGILISNTGFSQEAVTVFGRETTWASVALGTVIHGHLVAVLFRSHGNPNVLRRHPLRFLLVPLLVFAAIRFSPWIAVAATVVATFWDVWHSGMQTFGLGRIYERSFGNPPEFARRLDLWMNHLLYAGPILAGATMMDHFRHFGSFADVGTGWLAAVPAAMESSHHLWARGVMAAGTLFAAYYLYAHWRMYRAGHRFSPLRIGLIVSTGVCSLYTWGLNSFGEAFFIMNLFHAIQYLALVWAREHGRWIERIHRVGFPRRRTAIVVLAVGFLALVLSYGAWAELLDPNQDSLWAATLVVSLMHFWYDGFIWSVTRNQV